MQRLYITTPIYYVNDIPHIGHAYTTILADVITRFGKLLGAKTHFMTGTDEHGQKVQQAAQKRGVDPQAHVDEYNTRFKDLWVKLNVEHDHFIRTTDAHHKAYVQQKLQQLWDQGEIYANEYSGWYSVSEERFFSEDELVDGKDPIGGKAVEWLSEKNYFFKMSKYHQRLIDHLEQNPDYILPDFRRNEVLGFLRQPLQDLCISRPKNRLSWGIPLPFDAEYVTYVWFDALLNYASGVEGKSFEGQGEMWPADYHLIGKDILTTHAVYWSTMLMGLGMPLPKHILAHGWWLNGGAKMSKSSGTAINPMPYVDSFGVDAVRYYLMRDMVVGQDSSFTDDSFFRRLNSELANDLGNGLNRVYKLSQSNCEGRIPRISLCEAEEQDLRALCENGIKNALEHIQNMRISQALDETCAIVRGVNRYLEIRAPWKLAKNPEHYPLLATTLGSAAEALRIVFHLLQPVMPTLAVTGIEMLGARFEGKAGLQWKGFDGESPLGAHQVLFPRIEIQKEEKPTAHPLATLDLRVARIAEVSDHPNADSLYVLQVEDGEGKRQVCAGLKKSYAPSELLGRMVVLFANLKPAKLRGEESAGMLLAGDGDENKAVLLEVGEIPLGTRLCLGEHTPVAPTQWTLKEFDKFSFSVQDQKVLCENQVLKFQNLEIKCPVADGRSVH